MIYYHRILKSIITFDDETKTFNILTRVKLLEEEFTKTLEDDVFFDSKTGKYMIISENPEKFFLDYLPRTMDIKDKPSTVDDIKLLKEYQ